MIDEKFGCFVSKIAEKFEVSDLDQIIDIFEFILRTGNDTSGVIKRNMDSIRSEYSGNTKSGCDCHKCCLAEYLSDNGFNISWKIVDGNDQFSVSLN